MVERNALEEIYPVPWRFIASMVAYTVYNIFYFSVAPPQGHQKGFFLGLESMPFSSLRRDFLKEPADLK